MKSKITAALCSLILLCSVSFGRANMLSELSLSAVENVRDTSFRSWSAVSVYDFKRDQWLAAAMTNISIVEKYALHFDIGYAQPIDKAASARGSVLGGVSIHLDETKWFGAVADKLGSLIPILPTEAVGLFKYTTVGAVVGYNLDRSIDEGGRFSHVDQAVYGIFVGLEKRFDFGSSGD